MPWARECLASPLRLAPAASRSGMPEHHYALGKPTGPIHAEAASIDELVEAMQTMPWPSSW